MTIHTKKSATDMNSSRPRLLDIWPAAAVSTRVIKRAPYARYQLACGWWSYTILASSASVTSTGRQAEVRRRPRFECTNPQSPDYRNGAGGDILSMSWWLYNLFHLDTGDNWLLCFTKKLRIRGISIFICTILHSILRWSDTNKISCNTKQCEL